MVHQSPLHVLGTVARNVNSSAPSSEAPLDGLSLKNTPCSRSVVPLARINAFWSDLLVVGRFRRFRALILRSAQDEEVLGCHVTVGVGARRFLRGLGDFNVIVRHGAFERVARKVIAERQRLAGARDEVAQVHEVLLASLSDARGDAQLGLDDLESRDVLPRTPWASRLGTRSRREDRRRPGCRRQPKTWWKRPQRAAVPRPGHVAEMGK